ncbi:MAG: hypothetical protein AB7N91_10645 [Candidatus Tectimicrobiota bacterium]
MEVTCDEARAHRGLETQRQWSDGAIARPTPVLCGVFAVVTLLADAWREDHEQPVRIAAWYTNARPTFTDAMALGRRCLWTVGHFSTSSPSSDVVQIPRALFARLTDAVCDAA